ncbi:MAG TPA: hypothetical protein VGS12_04700 [Caulobacteraceae bacterium]|nr:hypothetical protein [Caulobacteraceae bacterium]
MTPRIVLHLGAPKTGSTYVQQRLAANRERLRERGVFFPRLPEVAAMAGNAKLLATALAGKPSPSFARAFPAIDVSRLDPAAVARRLIADWRPNDEALLLSAENLRPRHAPLLRALLPASAEVQPVLLIRRQDDWVDSYFNQLTKTGDIHESVAAFVERLCGSTDERFCRPDWLDHVEAWEAAFGSCAVIFYDEVKDRLFEAFWQSARLPSCDLADVAPVQESIDIFQLGYLLAGRTHSHAEFLARRAAAAAASARLGLTPRRHSVLGKAERIELKAAFAESNARLLARLGRGADFGLLNIDTEADLDLGAFLAGAEFSDFRRAADALLAAPAAI